LELNDEEKIAEDAFFVTTTNISNIHTIIREKELTSVVGKQAYRKKCRPRYQ